MFHRPEYSRVIFKDRRNKTYNVGDIKMVHRLPHLILLSSYKAGGNLAVTEFFLLVDIHSKWSKT